MLRSRLVLVAILTAASVGNAGEILWNAPGGGSFQSGGNWVGGVAPGTSDGAVFDLSSAGGYTVTFSSPVNNDLLRVRDDIVTLDVGGFTYGLLSGGASAVTVGESAGQSGELTIIDGLLSCTSGGTIVGFEGNGTLEIRDGGALLNNESCYIGERDGAVGQVSVIGVGSTWTGATRLAVGGVYHTATNGHGTLLVQDGGVVASGAGYVADGPPGTLSHGDVTVSGSGSRWDSTSQIHVGRAGSGTLTIDLGGTVSNTSSQVGYFAGSTGEVTVSGSGSVWSVSSSLTVGLLGEGTVNADTGGSVEVATWLFVADNSMVDVSGGGHVTIGTGPVSTTPGEVLIHPDGELTGSGDVIGDVVNAGTISPGASPGRLTITGTYEQQSSGVLDIEIGGTLAGVEFDQLSVSGTAVLDGTLNLTLVSGFVPAESDLFAIILSSGHSGSFASVTCPLGYVCELGDDAGDVTLRMTQYVAPAPLVATGEAAKTNRYLRFDASPTVGDGTEQVIRVRYLELDGYPPPPTAYLFAGPPIAAPDEDSAQPGQTFVAAPLQCELYAHDWANEGIVSVYGGEIVPNTRYQVQRAGANCVGLLTNESCWSSALEITTAKYGDVWPLYEDPANPPQPDFNDIAAMVNKFLAAGAAVAPIKAVAQLQPNCVFPDRAIDFRDIAADVQAFLSTPYASSYYGPCTCPSGVTCGVTACTSDLACGGGLCVEGFCRDECGRCTP